MESSQTVSRCSLVSSARAIKRSTNRTLCQVEQGADQVVIIVIGGGVAWRCCRLLWTAGRWGSRGGLARIWSGQIIPNPLCHRLFRIATFDLILSAQMHFGKNNLVGDI